MYTDRKSAKAITCPHLKGSNEGALCSVEKSLVRNIANADIKFCMSRHFETCHVYFNSIREESNLRAFMRAH